MSRRRICLTTYAGRYFWSRLYRLVSRQERLAFRGPQMADMDQVFAAHPLDEVCAIQWQRGVEHAYDALRAMPPSRWPEVVYEDFVTDPGRELERVPASLGLEADRHAQEAAARDVHGGSVGKGRAALDDATVARLTALVGASLGRFGYA